MIGVICPGCGKTLEFQDTAANKKGRCPSCRQRLDIPALPPGYDSQGGAWLLTLALLGAGCLILEILALLSTLLVAKGIKVSYPVGYCCVCGLPVSVLGLGLGILSCVLCERALARIHQGPRDPQGRKLIRVSYGIAVVVVVLSLVVLVALIPATLWALKPALADWHPG